MAVPALNLDIPNHKNNYMLPLDSPTSPHPNKTVDAVAVIFARVIQQNEQYLRSIHPNQPQYRCPKMISFFTMPDPELSLTANTSEFTQTTLDVVQARIKKFVHNFAYRTRMRNEALVGALVYLDRIVDASGIVVTRQNWLLVTVMCLITVQKMYDDFHYSLKDYARVVNIPQNVLARAEHSFLKLVKYDLVVSQQHYSRYRNYITAKYEDAALREAYLCSPMSTLNTFALSSVKDVADILGKTINAKGSSTSGLQQEKNPMDDVAENSDSDDKPPADDPTLQKTKLLGMEDPSNDKKESNKAILGGVALPEKKL